MLWKSSLLSQFCTIFCFVSKRKFKDIVQKLINLFIVFVRINNIFQEWYYKTRIKSFKQTTLTYPSCFNLKLIFFIECYLQRSIVTVLIREHSIIWHIILKIYRLIELNIINSDISINSYIISYINTNLWNIRTIIKI